MKIRRDTISAREFSISGDEFFLPAATQTPVALFMSDCRGFAKHGENRDVLETILLPRGFTVAGRSRNFAEYKDAKKHSMAADRSVDQVRLD